MCVRGGDISLSRLSLLTIIKKTNNALKSFKMVEGDTPPASWPTFTLQQLETAIGNAKTAQKYLFIWDKQGSVGTFMQYKG